MPARWCKHCMATYRAKRRERDNLLHGVDPNHWDWAAMLCKSIKATASVNKEPVDIQTFDAETLRCIATLQYRHCAISNTDLVFPAKLVTRGLGIAKWRDLLTDRRQLAASVDAIRVNKQIAWASGNVILVGHIYAVMYTCLTDLASLKEWCMRTQDIKVVIYDNNVIGQLREERCKRRLEAHKHGGSTAEDV